MKKLSILGLVLTATASVVAIFLPSKQVSANANVKHNANLVKDGTCTFLPNTYTCTASLVQTCTVGNAADCVL